MDLRWGIGIAAIFIILYQSTHLSNISNISNISNTNKEGFTWSKSLLDNFNHFEKTYNPNFVFDTNIIQQQASPTEVEYLLNNNKWPWSEDVKKMYQDAILTNSTSINPGIASNIAQTIYNETAMKQLLSWNSKEGTFLINGATIGHTKDLPANVNNIIRCGNHKNGSPIMETVSNLGYSSINGNMIQNITPIKNEDIPSVLSGFSFLKDPCNPCLPLNNPPDYSCPFSLNVGDGGEVSSIWQNLWGLGNDKKSYSNFSGTKTIGVKKSNNDINPNTFDYYNVNGTEPIYVNSNV